MLILKSDIGNKYSSTTVVTSIISKTGKELHQPTHMWSEFYGKKENVYDYLRRTFDEKVRLWRFE